MVRQPGGTSPFAPASKSSLIINAPLLPLEELDELEELEELEELDELDELLELEELDELLEDELEDELLLEPSDPLPPQALNIEAPIKIRSVERLIILASGLDTICVCYQLRCVALNFARHKLMALQVGSQIIATCTRLFNFFARI